MGLLTLRVAGLGPGESPDERASTTGALRAVVASPLGEVLLGVLVVGLVAYALWRLCEAAGGHRGLSGRRRHVARLLDLARTAVYAASAFSAADLLLTGATTSQEERADQLSVRIMRVEVAGVGAGRWAVAAGGAVLVLGAGYLVWSGLRRSFMDDLHTHRMPERLQRVVAGVGAVGYTSRAVVYGLAGLLGVQAAARFDPDGVSGFDATLRRLVAAPAGTALVGAAGVGLLAFGAFSLAQAVYRDT